MHNLTTGKTIRTFSCLGDEMQTVCMRCSGSNTKTKFYIRPLFAYVTFNVDTNTCLFPGGSYSASINECCMIASQCSVHVTDDMIMRSMRDYCKDRSVCLYLLGAHEVTALETSVADKCGKSRAILVVHYECNRSFRSIGNRGCQKFKAGQRCL